MLLGPRHCRSHLGLCRLCDASPHRLGQTPIAKQCPNPYRIEQLYKSFDVPGQVIKGLPFYEVMANKAEG